MVPGWPFRGSDAVAAGEVTRARLRGPGFRRVARDTYVCATVPDDPVTAIRSAATWAGSSAVVTGWSACRLHEVDVLPRPEPPVELAVVDRRMRPPAGVVVRRQQFDAGEVCRVDDLWVTTPLRTAYDLASRSDPVEAVVAADGLGRAGGFSGPDLATLAARHLGDRGCRQVDPVAALMNPLAESPPETRTRLVLIRGGVPAPVLQYEVREPSGAWLGRVDMAWPWARLALEYDGRDHTLADRRGRDLDRIDDLQRAGWTVIVVTSRQLYRSPERLVERVREALGLPS
jgi:hypothetical protein